jgi:hypothetical protein
MDAAFRYALYTHGFILVSAFPTIGQRADSPSSGAPKFVHPAHLSPINLPFLSAQQQLQADENDVSVYDVALRGTTADSDPVTSGHLSSSIQAGFADGISEDEQLKLAASALSHAILRRGLHGFPKAPELVSHGKGESNAGVQVSAVLQETCPTSSSPLNITDESVLADTHMATAYVNDALPQCLLWGLNQKGLLQYCVRDGDVPGVRLIPRHRLRLNLACSAYIVFTRLT